MLIKARGPVPKFCSGTCRHRAWEQKRAAQSGRTAVEVVERTLISYPSDTRGWIDNLRQLAREVRGTRLDVAEVLEALDAVYDAAAHSKSWRGDHDYW